jgi:hypothetical protein
MIKARVVAIGMSKVGALQVGPLHIRARQAHMLQIGAS